MPNGVSAMATISVQEGRATRIADYTSQKREAAKRGPSTLRRSLAAARKGVKYRREMAQGKHGRVTHGGGGIAWTSGALRGEKGKFTKNTGLPLDKPYSKLRATSKKWKGNTSPTPHWLKYVAPSDKQINKSAKATGMQSKLTKKKAKSK